MPQLTFQTAQQAVTLGIEQLAIAGWAGRDQAGVQHHIDELAAIGVKPPSTTPLFYRCAAELLTQHEKVQMLGADGSGEAEVCLLSDADGKLWVTVASDHTDRALEAVGVAVSKQLCAKPIATEAWAFDDVAAHWDALTLESRIVEHGAEVVYQHGTLAELLDVSTLMARLPPALARDGSLTPNAALLCGTVPAIGGIRPSATFTMVLIDPVRGETLTHTYHVHSLPVAE